MKSFSIKDTNKNNIRLICDYMEENNFNSFEKHFSRGYFIIVFKYKIQDFQNFVNKLSSILTEFILEFQEKNIIKNLINDEYSYFNESEKLIIYERFIVLNTLNEKDKNRKILFKSIKTYIINNTFFIYSGFVNFSISNYIESLSKNLQNAVNQYVVEREYYRFIDILRNHVRESIASPIIVHLIYIDGQGSLVDVNGDEIPLEKLNSEIVSDIPFTKNDLVLNTLIGIIPKKIVIHMLSPHDQFIKTLELVFEDKIDFAN